MQLLPVDTVKNIATEYFKANYYTAIKPVVIKNPCTEVPAHPTKKHSD
jgi:hypothetical protein